MVGVAWSVVLRATVSTRDLLKLFGRYTYECVMSAWGEVLIRCSTFALQMRKLTNVKPGRTGLDAHGRAAASER